MYSTIITFGTFDLFHIGHLNVLKRAKQLGHKLIVGVSSDKFNYSKKLKFPIVPETERMEILRSLKIVDEVFLEESMDLKKDYVLGYKADCLVMGDDWLGKFDDLKNVCDVVYLSRTENISTTERILAIRSKVD